MKATYCIVKWPASMLACGSEFLFRRLMTILALVLGSDSSASDCSRPMSHLSLLYAIDNVLYLLVIYRSCEHQPYANCKHLEHP